MVSHSEQSKTLLIFRVKKYPKDQECPFVPKCPLQADRRNICWPGCGSVPSKSYENAEFP
jgi:hypothetical protein